jgi:hypothetical protein
MKKKLSKRSKAKHPDLSPQFNLKTRADLLDQDYLHELNGEELEWLNKFNSEYVGASLDKDDLDNNLHNTKKLLKDCRDRNNARNRDVLTLEKAKNQLLDYEELYDEAGPNNYEDSIIEELDKKEVREAIDWLAENLERDEMKLEKTLVNEQNVPSGTKAAKSSKQKP